MNAPDNPNLIARLAYAEQGWRTFAGLWRKNPGPKKWDKAAFEGKKNSPTDASWNATLDPAEIARQVQEFGDRKIYATAIAWEGSGCFALDLDRKDCKDALSWLSEAEAEHGELPPTPTFLTPSGGQQRIFRVPKGYDMPRNSESRIAPGVDLRGEGGMSFVPPTVRPDGKAYQWKSGLSTAEVEVAEAPAWLIEAVLEASGPAAHNDDPLSELPSEKRAMVDALSQSKADNELKLLNQLSSKRNTLDERDRFRNLGFGLADAFKGTSHEDRAIQIYVQWALRWEPPEGKEKPDDEALEAEAQKVWASAKRGGATVKTAQKLISNMVDLPPDPALIEDVSEKVSDVGQDNLSDVILPGLLGELQDKLLRGNKRNARIVALAGAFVIQSALVGPYATLEARDGSTQLTLFVMLFAGTGSGKASVRLVLRSTLEAAARVGEMQTDPASAPAVHQALLNKRGVLTVVQDEAGRKQAENRADRNKHNAGAMTALMDVYGNERLGIDEKTYSNAKNAKAAISPVFLTFLRMSQRELYLDSTGKLDSASGELNRFLIFGEKDTLERNVDPADRDGLHVLGPLVKKAVKFFSDLLPVQAEIKMTDEAQEVYEAFDKIECEAMYRQGGHVRQSWERAPLHAKRIAGHIALAEALGAGVEQVDGKLLIRAKVEAGHMRLALRIVRACMAEVVTVAKRAVLGEVGALKDEVETVIHMEIAAGRGVGAGSNFVKRSVITGAISRFSHMKKREKDDFFDDMVADERLVEDYISPPKGGRAAQAFAVRKRG